MSDTHAQGSQKTIKKDKQLTLLTRLLTGPHTRLEKPSQIMQPFEQLPDQSPSLIIVGVIDPRISLKLNLEGLSILSGSLNAIGPRRSNDV